MISASKLTTTLLTTFFLVSCHNLPKDSISFEEKTGEEQVELESTTPESSPKYGIELGIIK